MQAADRLYQQRKKQVEKTDKAREDYEFERQGAECTFQPVFVSKGKRKGKVTQTQTSEVTLEARQPASVVKEDAVDAQAQREERQKAHQ